LQGNGEAVDRWRGKTKHRLISYFLIIISAKNYHNRIMYVKMTASQEVARFFETQCSEIKNSALVDKLCHATTTSLSHNW